MDKFKILDFEEVKDNLSGISFRQLHIHHTWKPAHSSFGGDNHIALQVAMKQFHVGVNGWDDIGQHLSLMPDGKWVSGRDLRKDPASIKGWNKGALAVEMIGNFDIAGTGDYNILGYDKLEGEQKLEILKLIRYFGNRFGYENIVFHREGPGVRKTCPGTSLNKEMLIEETKGLEGYLEDGNISLWARDAIDWARENDLVYRIDPKENISLERLLTIIHRFSKLNI